jgi:hypothetical protein
VKGITFPTPARGWGNPAGLEGEVRGLFLLAFLGFFLARRANPLLPLVHPPARFGQVLEHFFIIVFHLLVATAHIALNEAEFSHCLDQSHGTSPYIICFARERVARSEKTKRFFFVEYITQFVFIVKA